MSTLFRNISMILLIVSVFAIIGCAPALPVVADCNCNCDVKNCVSVYDVNNIIDLTNDLIEYNNKYNNASIDYLPYYKVEE